VRVPGVSERAVEKQHFCPPFGPPGRLLEGARRRKEGRRPAQAVRELRSRGFGHTPTINTQTDWFVGLRLVSVREALRGR
jgi:hypothetical protein